MGNKGDWSTAILKFSTIHSRKQTSFPRATLLPPRVSKGDCHRSFPFSRGAQAGIGRGNGTIVDSRRSLDELTTFTASVAVSKHVWWIFSRARYLQIKLTEFRFGISFGFRLFRRWNSWEFSRPGEWEEATERRKDLQVFLSRFRFWYERMFRRWSANFVYFTFSFFSSSSKMKRISRW